MTNIFLFVFYTKKKPLFLSFCHKHSTAHTVCSVAKEWGIDYLRTVNKSTNKKNCHLSAGLRWTTPQDSTSGPDHHSELPVQNILLKFPGNTILLSFRSTPSFWASGPDHPSELPVQTIFLSFRFRPSFWASGSDNPSELPVQTILISFRFRPSFWTCVTPICPALALMDSEIKTGGPGVIGDILIGRWFPPLSEIW